MAEQTTGTDLHTRIREALEERIRLAKACPTQVWSADPTGTVCADEDLRPDGDGGEILPPDGPMEVAECYRNTATGERAANAAHIAANDPATTIRRAERDLRTLDRHKKCMCDEVDEADASRIRMGIIAEPDKCDACIGCGQTWPCADVRDLADGERIEVGDGR